MNLTMARTFPSAALMCVALAACGDSTGPAGEELLVSGTIQNNTQTPIPANARLLVAWAVFTGTDHTYVFGEGTINRADETFSVTLPDAPPTAALNADAVGVGIIFVTTNSSITTGWDVEAIPPSDVIGAAGAYGIIYVADEMQAQALANWTGDFEHGYGVGQGQAVQGSFDIFVPADPGSVVLIIDDLNNIEFVNWS